VNLFASPRIALVIALLAGGLLPLAFAPFGFYPLAVICPALLLMVWLPATAQQAFNRGLLFGIGLFGIGASWIFVSIHEFGNTSFFLAGLITAIFVFVLGMFIAAQGYFFTRFFPTNTGYKLCLAFPCCWVMFEWLRSWVLSGFPWLFLGASQTAAPLRGFAPLVGEFGLSFLVALSSGLLVYAYCKKHRAWLSITALIVLWACGAALTLQHWTQPEGKPLQISIVQGNIPQQMKWDPAYLQMTLQRYSELTQPHWNSQLVFWPEAAIPLLYQQAKPFLDGMAAQAKQHNAAFITGIPVQDGFDYYNAIVALGTGQGIYYKRHLVPFGEYVPLDSLLRGLIGFFDIPMSNFSAGPAHQEQLHAANLVIAPFVCYEIAYPNLVLPELPQANLLVTLSNDAWFGHSFASAQHLQISQLRALETGRYHIFGSNTGVSAIIDPQGNIQASTPAFQSVVLTNTVLKMTGATPLVTIGVNAVLLSVALLLFLALWLEWRPEKLPQELVQQG